ncbi:MAG: hypothetical protein IPL63_04955 [Saprospiraceae bacterium]|nr:hypothetical protein [Saprospiraceae bacterium]MBK6565743.1 hypothetical protein [Saprospiraceae bacterium]MBK6784609.1 hypothetical protein [Saprospiraceae bacterium]MBK7525221.1 hypothetical protein [Saprospiraceae bacterium]MBK8370245.1 hypothetical protein [Saprospiraceae bacterium]
MQKDSLLTGFVLGALVPVFGFIVIDFIFSLLTQYSLIEEVTSSTSGKRMRTILLFSICCNLIPFQMAKKERYDNTLRGIVFPTLIYVIFWVYKFYGGLF